MCGDMLPRKGAETGLNSPDLSHFECFSEGEMWGWLGAKNRQNGCLITSLRKVIFAAGENGLFFAFLVLKSGYGIPISKAGTQEQGVVSEACCAAAGSPYDGIHRFALVADTAGLVCFCLCFFGGGHAGELPELGVVPPS